MLLIGYHSTCAYKLYCPITNNVKVNRYVIVKELEAWDLSNSQSNSSIVSTLEYDSDFEGDSASEGDSSYEGDYDSGGESESEDDSDTEGESDSKSYFDSEGEFDSKVVSESNGDFDSDGGPNSEFDHAFKGGHAYEGRASKGGASESGPSSEGELAQFQRPQRVRHIPKRHVDFKFLHDTKIDSEGEVIQSTVMMDFEPISINDALKKNVWVNAMQEELEDIKRNKTWELTALPQNKKAISVRCVFKIKMKPYGSVAKH